MDKNGEPLPEVRQSAARIKERIMKKIFGMAAGTAAALTLLAAAPLATHAEEGPAEQVTTAAVETIESETTTATIETTAETTTSETQTTTAAPETTTEAVTTTASETGTVVPMEPGWNTDESGRIFYYRTDGTYLTGVQEIDGESYIFSANGVLKTGWRTVNGRRMYFDPKTGAPVYGWLEYCGKNYFIEQDKGKLIGLAIVDEANHAYIFDAKGAALNEKGFISFGEDLYYISDEGTLLSGDVVIEGLPYRFGEDFAQETGWVDFESGRYYYDPETGAAMTGLVKISNEDGEHVYYISPEEGLLKGDVTIDGVLYSFDEETGELKSGWQEVDGRKRYIKEDGSLAVGTFAIDGSLYVFDEEGYMGTGFTVYDGDTYYSLEDGKLLCGRLIIDGSKYYFKTDYKMATGFQVIDSKTYYFAEDGKMMTGLQTIGENKYYFGDDGAMLTGRLLIDGSKYYFAADGTMQFGMVTLDDGTYYFDENGKMYTGWVSIDHKNYHFAADGKLDTNKTVDGRNVNSQGFEIALSAVQQQAKTILSSTGKSLDAIYNYIRNNNKYKYIEDTKSLATIESLGWASFAQYALNNRYVVCYYFAAVTDLMFQMAGYETRIVYGTGRGSGDHYWNQVYQNGVWVNYDTCNGYYAVTFEYLQTQNYTLYKYVNAKFF